MQHILDKSSEQVHSAEASEQGTSNSLNNLKLPAKKLPM
jgi:hypothetical protein